MQSKNTAPVVLSLFFLVFLFPQTVLVKIPQATLTFIELYCDIFHWWAPTAEYHSTISKQEMPKRPVEIELCITKVTSEKIFWKNEVVLWN